MDLADLIRALLIAFVPIAFSVVAQLLRKTLEFGQPAANWQSWAALYGDNVTLPIGLLSAGIVLRDDLPGMRWLIVSVVITLVIAVVARSMDRSGFTKSGDRDRLYSPTKLLHDFATWPVVGTLVIWLVPPAVMSNTLLGYIALGGVVGWVLLVVRDMSVGLSPALMHPRVQDTAIARFFPSFR